MNKKVDKSLIISIIIPLGIGLIISILTKNGLKEFTSLNLDFIPPSFVFAIVWTILYILMGISCYLIYNSIDYYRPCCLLLYATQLLINFMWPLLFFGLKLYLFSFIWLIILIILIAYMIWCFYNINKKAAYLNIPYLIWCLFAAYLNLMVYLTTR